MSTNNSIKIRKKEQHLIKIISNLRNGLLHVLSSELFSQQQDAIQSVIEEIKNLNNIDSLSEKIEGIDFNAIESPEISEYELIQFIQNQNQFNLPEKSKEELKNLEQDITKNNISFKKAQRRYFEINHRITQQFATIRSADKSIHKTSSEESYKEGTEQILETDLILASRSMAKDIIKIANKLIETGNDDEDVLDISKEAQQLAHGRAKFFNSLDLLSRTTHHIVKIKQNENERYKQYFIDFHKQIDDAFSIINNQNKSNNDLEEQESSFIRNFDKSINNVEDSINSSDSIEDIRKTVSEHIESLKTNVSTYKKKQEEIHSQSRKQIDKLQDKIRYLSQQQEEMKEKIEEKKQQLIVDDLTLLYNKVAYEEDVKELYKEWGESSGSKTINLAVVDIDYFKSINDKHGHHIGDLILQEISCKMQQIIGDNGTVYRWGGEEFVILFAGLSFEASIKETVKLRIQLQNNPINVGEDFNSFVTISGGVAPFLNYNDTPKIVFKRADNALYFAKHNGRNRISYYNKKNDH